MEFLIVFYLMSFAGWILESIYANMKDGKWQNRGFLYGPLCPIYGIGGIGVYLFYLFSDIRSTPLLFCIFALGSAVLEYMVSFVLEKVFHAVWWDYHYMPLNLNGRICLPASLCFGLIGTTIYVFGIPFYERHILAYAKTNQTIIFTGLLVLVYITGMDTAFTLASITKAIQLLETLSVQMSDTINFHEEQFRKKKKMIKNAVLVKMPEELSENIIIRIPEIRKMEQRQLLNIKKFSVAKIERKKKKLLEILGEKD